MKLRIIGLALSLSLVLTACGGEGDGGGRASFLGRAAGISEEETLLTVDGRAVPGWRYLYWLAAACDQLAEEYRAAGEELDWQAQTDQGTPAQWALRQALADTALYATVENWAEQYGCALTESDRERLEADWAEQAGDDEAAALAALRDRGLDRERARELAGVGLLYAQLCALAAGDGPAAADAEALEAFAGEAGYLTVDRILIPAGDGASEQAAEAFSALNGASDIAAVFDRLSAAGADTAGPRTLQPGDGTLDPELEQAALALEEGQCSGILETAEGYSILRRLPTDTAAVETAFLDRRLQDAAAAADIRTGEDYASLDPAAFYQALEALRQAGA